MARTRLELLARHAAVLFVSVGLNPTFDAKLLRLRDRLDLGVTSIRSGALALGYLPVQFLYPRALSALPCAKVLRGLWRRPRSVSRENPRARKCAPAHPCPGELPQTRRIPSLTPRVPDTSARFQFRAPCHL